MTRTSSDSSAPRTAAVLRAWAQAGVFQPLGSGAAAAIYAAVVEPIAQSVIALAFASDDAVRDITDNQSCIYSQIESTRGPRSKFLVVNPSPLSADDLSHERTAAWGPGGYFGFEALTLEVGCGDNGPQAELTLSLSLWNDGSKASQPDEFALIKFSTRGQNDNYRSRGLIRGNGYEATVRHTAALEYALGIESVEGFVLDGCSGYDFDRCLGFPYAGEVLLSKLPLLCEYLTHHAGRLAAQLSEG